ncbi:lysozyme inhibitor LprI family protein [Caulobacter endophyticus]|uniref:lysozyme inhibitor LprI family protein n=1 Tax=Caulobacter endophyticus TaxID=2172652 RepID=UPI00240FD653|nr:lysozyme inhibitor LprI family protein [Caulobacter endophyticus]MDG2528212.1 lysozyme inhibitor LprI family protein [Caulobacter endophyticus]
MTLTLAVLASNAAAQTAPVPPPPDRPPLLDCAQKVFVAETIVCESPDLLAQNGRVEAAYLDLRGRLAPAAATVLEDEQRAWLARRNACVFKSSSRGYIARANAARLKDLARLTSRLGERRPSG